MVGGGHYAHENATIQDLRGRYTIWLRRDLRLDNDNADDDNGDEEDGSSRRKKILRVAMLYVHLLMQSR